MRIVGPNCIGMLNFKSKAGVTFMIPPPMEAPLPHAIGLVSQSGALGFSLAQSVMRGVSVSHLLTTGNSSDVDVADCVSFLADDPACRAIACVFEGMPDPMRFIQAAEVADAANKPLVVFKLGTGEAGAAAAMSHTGSLAGEQAAYLAAFERAGAVVVKDFEALVETAAFLAKAPAPRARGVAVVAVSGGAAIMSADKAEAHDVPLPQPTPAGAGHPRIAHPGFRLGAEPLRRHRPGRQRPGKPDRLRLRHARRGPLRRADLRADLLDRTLGQAPRRTRRHRRGTRQADLRGLDHRMARRHRLAGGRAEPAHRPVPLDGPLLRHAVALACTREPAAPAARAS